MKFLINSGLVLLSLLMSHTVTAYTPIAEKVTDNVYALIGPLGQRSEKNDGLNNNLGFIITANGVILIDSGASLIGAKRIEKAILGVTQKPIKWVINTGSQDHRWLGNHYFASKGAKLIAMKRTAETQRQYAEQHMSRMAGFLKERFKGTVSQPANQLLEGEIAEIVLDGQKLELQYNNAHFPGDAWIWLPKQSVVFTGDLVYVDRLFALLPWSSVINGHQAFQKMTQLNPQFIVPGHGQVSSLDKAVRECGDYYKFLVDNVGSAAENMESLIDVVEKYKVLPRFQHLKNYQGLHPTNLNRSYLEFEQL